MSEEASASHSGLQDKLFDLLKADRWVESLHPAVAPESTEEVRQLLQGFPGCVMIVGAGTEFSADFDPGKETLMLMTSRLRNVCDVSTADQTITVSGGRSIAETRLDLADYAFTVPALERFKMGTIGGRLASIPSCPQARQDDGWMHYLLGMDVVLPSGELMSLGGRCIKDVAGYDLKHIFTGSRGSAGVIVTATFRCKSVISAQMDTPEYYLPEKKKFDPHWKRILDPLGRMHSGM